MKNTQTLRDFGLVVWGFAAVGLVAGLVWALFAPYSDYTRFDGGVGQGQLELSQVWNANGWFVVIGAVAALAAGLFFGFRRRLDPVAVVLGAVLGSVVGVALMVCVGMFAGPSDPTSDLVKAAVGTSAGAPLARPPFGILLVWPIAALLGVLVGLLTAPESRPRVSAPGEVAPLPPTTDPA